MKSLILSLLMGGALYGAASVLPANVSLTGPEARQQLLLVASDGTYQEDLTRSASWTSSNPNVVAVDGAGLLKPVGDGEATITAKSGANSASAKVKVANAKADFTWSFRNH